MNRLIPEKNWIVFIDNGQAQNKIKDNLIAYLALSYTQSVKITLKISQL